MKKRILSLLLTFVLVLALLPVLPSYATDYDLWVCGTRVTSENCDSLFSGKVQFLPSSKTLYIKGDLSADTAIIESQIQGLTVKAAKTDGGSVKLTSTNEDVIKLKGTTYFNYCNMDVEQNGGSNYASAFRFNSAEYLWFSNSTVKASAGWTIYGGGTGHLRIRSSNMTIDGKARAVCSFSTDAGIELTDCAIIQPVGGVISGDNSFIADAEGGTYATHVEISDTIYYDLWIAGTQVTSKNQYNVLGDNKFQFYEPRTLVVKGDCTSSESIIDNKIDGLVISTDAPGGAVCQLISNNHDTIVSTGSLTFSAAKLSLSTYAGGSSDSAIYMKGTDKTLTFSHSGIYASGDYTVYCESGTTIAFNYTDLKVDATDRAIAMNATDGITFDTSYIDKPAGAVITKYGIMESDGTSYAKNVVISKGTPYDLWICGNRVNTFNCSDVLGDGVFKYDNAAKKLTVNGNCSYVYSIINSEVDNLKIVVTGDSTLTTTGGASAIFLKKTTLIEGENGSKLTVKSANAGINLNSGSGLEFRKLDLTVNAPIGIVGNSSADLSFTNSVAEITSNSSGGAVYGFNAINLSGCVLNEPAGGRIEGGAIVNSDGSGATHVVIGEPPVEYYDLYICGTQVTSENALDVLGDGVFAYRNNQKRLTLSKSMPADASTVVIQNYIPGLTIWVPTDVTLSTTSGDVITSYKDLKITGAGTLTLHSGTDSGIYMRDCATLTLDGADVVADGQWGIVGYPAGEKLIVKNSKVKATGPNGAVCDFSGGITLTGSTISKPIGGKIVDGKIVDKNGELATEVEIGAELVNPFVDVKKGEYYYDPVLWAYYHTPQITTGTDKTHFSPNDTCTRAQIVTFLWRANGCPEPTLTESPFVDVKDPGQYYYKAVLWAVEKKITTGTDKTHFSPEDGCTRGQVVTFQWRAKGEPAPGTSTNPFVDVKKGEYYYDAVLWAVGKGVTTGTDATHFAPNDTCTRGQIVTFLYRDMA